MTIESTVRRAGPFDGNGIATVFPFEFKVFLRSEVVATLATLATGVEETLILDTHYSVSLNADQNNNPGGEVTYPLAGSPMAATHTLTLTSGVTATQGADIQNAGGFFPEVIEDALDREMIVTQQEAEKNARALRFPVSDVATDNELPTISQRASMVLGFDAQGKPVAVVNVPTGGVPASAFGQTLLDDADEAEARDTLGFQPATHLQDKKGADIAAAATVNLDTATGDLVFITGAGGPITQFTLADGVEKTLFFTGAPVITHDVAKILCPGGVNIQVFAGDSAKVRGGVSNLTRVLAYTPNEQGMLSKLATTKGDELLATAARTFARKGAGAEGEFRQVDPADASGHAYVKLGAGDVRQSVLSSALDASGYSNAVSAGTGLSVKLDASPTPMVLAFAAGFGKGGAQDLVSVLSADVDPIISSLPASNTTYGYADWASLSSVTWGKTQVPPQVGYAFDRTQNALLHFDGTDAATTTTDDFGNTWTATGNAQLDTAQSKFGASSLLVDGTGDYFGSSNFTTLGPDSWEISCWFRANATAGAVNDVFCAFGNASGFGVELGVAHNGGTRKIALRLSSNGTTNDILGGPTLGTTTLSLATWYKARLVFDALAGTYRVYVSNNGGAEVQEITTSNTARICAITIARIGSNIQADSQQFNGWVDEFRLIRCASATAAETPKASAFTVNETSQLVNFFSIPKMQMFEVTAASGTAGVDPTLTARNRVFQHEADTSGAAVAAVRNYALRGVYHSAPTALPANGAGTIFTDNIGLSGEHVVVSANLINRTADSGWKPGEIMEAVSFHNPGGTDVRTMPPGRKISRTTTEYRNGADGSMGLSATSGATFTVTAANWLALLSAARRW